MGQSVNSISYRLGVSFFWKTKFVTPTHFFYYSFFYDSLGVDSFVTYIFFRKYSKILAKKNFFFSHMLQRFFVNKVSVKLFVFDIFFFQFKKKLLILFKKLFIDVTYSSYRKRLKRRYSEQLLQPYDFLAQFNLSKKNNLLQVAVKPLAYFFVSFGNLSVSFHTLYNLKNLIFIKEERLLFENTYYSVAKQRWHRFLASVGARRFKQLVPKTLSLGDFYGSARLFGQNVMRLASDFFSFGVNKSNISRGGKHTVLSWLNNRLVNPKSTVVSKKENKKVIKAKVKRKGGSKGGSYTEISNSDLIKMVMEYCKKAILDGKTVEQAVTIESLLKMNINLDPKRLKNFTISKTKLKALHYHYTKRPASAMEAERKAVAEAKAEADAVAAKAKLVASKQVKTNTLVKNLSSVKANINTEAKSDKLDTFVDYVIFKILKRRRIFFCGKLHNRVFRNYLQFYRMYVVESFRFFEMLAIKSKNCIFIIWRIFFKSYLFSSYFTGDASASLGIKKIKEKLTFLKIKKNIIPQVILSIFDRFFFFKKMFLFYFFFEDSKDSFVFFFHSLKFKEEILSEIMHFKFGFQRYFLDMCYFFKKTLFAFGALLHEASIFKESSMHCNSIFFKRILRASSLYKKHPIYLNVSRFFFFLFQKHNVKLVMNLWDSRYFLLDTRLRRFTNRRVNALLLKKKKKRALSLDNNTIFEDSSSFFSSQQAKKVSSLRLKKKKILKQSFYVLFLLSFLLFFFFFENSFYYLFYYFFFLFCIFKSIINKLTSSLSIKLTKSIFFLSPIFYRKFFYKQAKISFIVLSLNLNMYFYSKVVVKTLFFFKSYGFFRFFIFKSTYFMFSFFFSYKLLSLISSLEKLLFNFNLNVLSFYNFYWEFIFYLLACCNYFYNCSLLFFYEIYVQYLLDSFLNKVVLADFFSEKFYKRFFFKKIKVFNKFLTNKLLNNFNNLLFFIKKYDSISKFWFDTLRFMTASYNLYKLRTGTSTTVLSSISVIGISLYKNFFFSKYFLIKSATVIKKELILSENVFKFSSILLNLFFTFLGKNVRKSNDLLLKKEKFSFFKNGMRLDSLGFRLKKNLFSFYCKKQKRALLFFTFRNFWRQHHIIKTQRSGNKITLARGHGSALPVNLKDAELVNLLLSKTRAVKSSFLDFSIYLCSVKKISFFKFFLKQFNLGAFYINYNLVFEWFKGYFRTNKLLKGFLNELLYYNFKNDINSSIMENNWIVLLMLLFLFFGRFYNIKKTIIGSRVPISGIELLELQLFFFWSVLTIVYKDYCFNYWIRFLAVVKKFIREKFVSLLEAKLMVLAKKKVEISIIDLHLSSLTPEILFYFYKKKLSKYYNFRSILSSVFYMLLELDLINGAYVVGFGRFTKRQRASGFKLMVGKLYKMDLGVAANTYSSFLITKYGVCSLRIYLSRQLKRTDKFVERSDYLMYSSNKIIYKNVKFS